MAECYRPHLLEGCAFISGAALMITEVAGLRSLAPFLGGSITVSSAVVGVVLASLSIGSYFGGRLIDKNPRESVVSRILFAAALLIALIPSVNRFVPGALASRIDSIELAAIFSALIVFGPASGFLGAIYPMCAGLYPSMQSKPGTSIGRISALSNAGCILGTFLAGFWLLPVLGLSAAFYVAAVILLPFALWLSLTKARPLMLVTLLSALLYGTQSRPSNLLVERESLYAHLRIEDGWNGDHSRRIRTLRTDPFTLQGARYLDSVADHTGPIKGEPFAELQSKFIDFSETLAVPYTRYFRLAAELCGAQCRALVVGGGAFSFPQDFIKNSPDRALDVVEIDPEITRVAREFFELTPSAQMRLYSMDGRVFLNRSRASYDLIVLDAFSSAQSIPHYLVSQETFAIVAERLSENGILAINLMSSLSGDSSGLFASVHKTLSENFHQISVFAVSSPQLSTAVQNVVLLAKKAEPFNLRMASPRHDLLLAHEWKGGPPPFQSVLTDDTLLVERYSAQLVRGLKRGYAG